MKEASEKEKSEERLCKGGVALRNEEAVRAREGDGQTKPVIGFRIKAVNNMIRRKLDMRFIEAGMEELSGMQGPLLGFLSDYSTSRDVFQKDIEREFNIRRSTATVILQNLEQKGYIVRRQTAYDARLKKILLTDKAVEADKAIRREIDAFHEELERGITAEEKEIFFTILDKVMKNLT